ncbi:hypothetical protein BH708_13860 [Brachybacterium sp. P6-10-X1]|nr:hypothetical protein BH708_13860 [Brachybacterium sp. P6-10-X1]
MSGEDSAPTPSAGYGAQRTGVDDSRQASPELAAWTIASAAALAVPGVASLTSFEQRGTAAAIGDGTAPRLAPDGANRAPRLRSRRA